MAIGLFIMLYWTGVFIWLFYEGVKSEARVNILIAEMKEASNKRIQQKQIAHEKLMKELFSPEVLHFVAKENRLKLNLQTEPRW